MKRTSLIFFITIFTVLILNGCSANKIQLNAWAQKIQSGKDEEIDITDRRTYGIPQDEILIDYDSMGVMFIQNNESYTEAKPFMLKKLNGGQEELEKKTKDKWLQLTYPLKKEGWVLTTYRNPGDYKTLTFDYDAKDIVITTDNGDIWWADATDRNLEITEWRGESQRQIKNLLETSDLRFDVSSKYTEYDMPKDAVYLGLDKTAFFFNETDKILCEVVFPDEIAGLDFYETEFIEVDKKTYQFYCDKYMNLVDFADRDNRGVLNILWDGTDEYGAIKDIENQRYFIIDDDRSIFMYLPNIETLKEEAQSLDPDINDIEEDNLSDDEILIIHQNNDLTTDITNIIDLNSIKVLKYVVSENGHVFMFIEPDGVYAPMASDGWSMRLERLKDIYLPDDTRIIDYEGYHYDGGLDNMPKVNINIHKNIDGKDFIMPFNELILACKDFPEFEELDEIFRTKGKPTKTEDESEKLTEPNKKNLKQ